MLLIEETPLSISMWLPPAPLGAVELHGTTG